MPGPARGPLRTGPAAYIIVGALALGLVLVIAMAITSKQISDQPAEKASPRAELAAATARADSLRAFSDFRDVQEARTPDRLEPRPEPLRLGARPARALPGHPRGRLAGEAERHREPRGPAHGRRRDPDPQLDRRARPGDRRLRARPRTRSRASSPPSRTSTASPGSASVPRRAPRRTPRRRAQLRARRGGRRGLPDASRPSTSSRSPSRSTRSRPRDRRAGAGGPLARAADEPAGPARRGPGHRGRHRCRPDRARPRRPPTSSREREAEMKTTDRAVLIGFLAVGLLVGFYMMVLSPKREEAKTLGDEVAALEAQIAEQEQPATFAQQARRRVPEVLRPHGRAGQGRARGGRLRVAAGSAELDVGATPTRVPDLALAQAGGTAAPRPDDPAAHGRPGRGHDAASRRGSAAPGEGPAATTGRGPRRPPPRPPRRTLPDRRDGRSRRPPDASLRPRLHGQLLRDRGLPRRARREHQAQRGSGQVTVDGRLQTVDGFALKGGAPGSRPTLEASFLMTTYLTPADRASPSARRRRARRPCPASPS